MPSSSHHTFPSAPAGSRAPHLPLSLTRGQDVLWLSPHPPLFPIRGQDALQLSPHLPPSLPGGRGQDTAPSPLPHQRAGCPTVITPSPLPDQGAGSPSPLPHQGAGCPPALTAPSPLPDQGAGRPPALTPPSPFPTRRQVTGHRTFLSSPPGGRAPSWIQVLRCLMLEDLLGRFHSYIEKSLWNREVLKKSFWLPMKHFRPKSYIQEPRVFPKARGVIWSFPHPFIVCLLGHSVHKRLNLIGCHV